MTIAERKAREKEQRRATILSTAERLFAHNGYHTTTMDVVAEEVELSKATLYLYFKNKEDLFFSIIEEKIDNYMHEIKESLEKTKNLIDTIIEIVTHQLAFLQDNHHFFRLAISEQCKIEQSHASELHQRFISKQKQIITMIESGLSKHMGEGFGHRFNPKSLALCIVGSINAHMMNWLVTGGNYNVMRSKDDIIEIIINGVT